MSVCVKESIMTEVTLKVQVPSGLDWEQLDNAVYEELFNRLAEGSLQELFEKIVDNEAQL